MWNDAQSRAFTVMWNDTQRGDAQSRAFTTMWNGAEVQTAHMLTQRGDAQSRAFTVMWFGAQSPCVKYSRRVRMRCYDAVRGGMLCRMDPG